MYESNTNIAYKSACAFAGALVAGSLAISSPARAQDDSEKKREVEVAPNRAWVSVSGTIVSTTPESFRLDYGDGIILVEMDDFDAYADGRPLMADDEVIVYGRIDDDLFEKRKIEASSVYVENLNTHFYANAADEEDYVGTYAVDDPIVPGRLELTGTVTSVIGREFTIDTGTKKVQVDTAGLPYDPMDDAGFLRIEKGDKVKVGGKIDVSFIDDTELSADWIVELRD